MLYLTMQILVIVVVAILLGLWLGWWSRGLMADMQQEDGYTGDDDIDPFDARSRLEQCHRDNAELRRDLKELEDQLEQRERVEILGHKEGDMIERLKAAELRAEALMEDIQTRDDTIAILEHELEKIRPA